MKQTTEIELEFSETVTYDSRHDRFSAHCPQCLTVTEMATAPIAARLSGFSERYIFRLIESGQVHFQEHDRVLVCLNSLRNTKEIRSCHR